MIRIDTGEKIELHTHNVKFEDSTREIFVDAGTETYWIGADRVSLLLDSQRGLRNREVTMEKIKKRKKSSTKKSAQSKSSYRRRSA